MPKFSVSLEVAGYCRGYKVFEVEAKTAEEAKENYWSGELIDEEIIRDDREGEVSNVVEIIEEEKI